MQASTNRFYETIFIAPPTLAETDVEQVITEVKDTFTSRGADVARIERWGRRKLAYPVKRHAEGWYVLMHVRGGGEAVLEAERRMRISERVMKFLTVRLDDVAGAMEATEQRIKRIAQQDEERRTRAAERAQQVARDDAERSRRAGEDEPEAEGATPSDDDE